MADSGHLKTAEQLRQEESDAELARRLQNELNAEPSATEAAAPAVPTEEATPGPSMKDGVVSIACAKCTFINEVKKPMQGKRYACVQCRTPLPIPASMLSAPPAAKKKVVDCASCGYINDIPAAECDAFLCGMCYQVLDDKAPSAAAPAPQRPAGKQPPPPQRQQQQQQQKVAPAPPAMKTVQVKCGQCGAINAVEVDASASTIRFECGVCEIVNEVNLS